MINDRQIMSPKMSLFFILGATIFLSSSMTIQGATRPKMMISAVSQAMLDDLDLQTELSILKPVTREGMHVAYYGAGNDTLRLIRDYPNADHFHLYDIIDYAYIRRRIDLINDTRQSLRLVAEDGKVVLEDRGFLDHVPHSALYDPVDLTKANGYFQTHLPKDLNLRKPMIFKIRMKTPSGAVGEKHIYLHPVDFYSPEQIQMALDQIPTGRLHAMITKGTGIPTGKSFDIVGQKLAESGGSFVLITSIRNGRPQIPWSSESKGIKRDGSVKSLAKALGSKRVTNVVTGKSCENLLEFPTNGEPDQQIAVAFEFKHLSKRIPRPFLAK